MSEKKQKIFFNGLNELRALAALAVVVHHVEFLKLKNGYSSLVNINKLSYFISKLGANAVDIFFVISGFLITYLLLKEKENNFGKIALKQFYARRVLRIWPLYYLIVIVSIFIVPVINNSFEIFSSVSYYHETINTASNYTPKIKLLYFLFFPNLALNVYKVFVACCSQTWSVGVEEQFYILWPLLILLFNKKQILWIFILILFFFRGIQGSAYDLLIIIDKAIPFQHMAIGALGGFLYVYYRELMERIGKSKWLYFILISSLLFLLFKDITGKFYQSLLMSFLTFGIIICSINNQNKFVFRNKFFAYLGTISYGIYMYHPLVMYIVFAMINSWFHLNNVMYNVVSYLAIISLTIIISHFSYKYFESYFLKIKEKKFNSL